jgi:tellurite resistance protein TerC
MVFYFLGFIALIISLLALDLGVFHRKDEIMSTKAALGWTVFWIAIALLFNCLVYVLYEHHWLGIGTKEGLPQNGMEAFLAFLTAYLVEKSLSIDNIFVIAVIFSYFRIPKALQHRVLFWGILGALIMRGLMIAAGIAAISYFSWLTYVLGGFLIFTALRMFLVQHDNLEPEKSLMVRLIAYWFPLSHQFHGHKFLVKIDGRWSATPLCLALVLIESTDLLFAIDSIPAVLAITLDPFIVFTSNVFAILGMRALYFALASLLDRFRYLKTSLVFVLAFVGSKMILAHHIHISSTISLIIILGILILGVIASLVIPKKADDENAATLRAEISRISKVTIQTVKKVFLLAAGSTIILIGAIMVFLPGPGVFIMILGLGLLAIEFVWARVWIKKIQNRMQDLQSGAKKFLERKKKSS